MSVRVQQTFLSLQTVFILSALCLLHRNVFLFGQTFSFSALLFPLTFILNYIATAVYGFHTARRLLVHALLAQLPFVLIFVSAHSLPSPPSISYEDSYCLIFGGMWRISVAMLLGTLAAQYTSMWLFTQSYTQLKKLPVPFIIILAALAGDLIFSATSLPLMFMGPAKHPIIMHTQLISFIVKLTLSIILSLPATWLIQLLNFYESNHEADKYLSFSYHPLQWLQKAF